MTHIERCRWIKRKLKSMDGFQSFRYQHPLQRRWDRRRLEIYKAKFPKKRKPKDVDVNDDPEVMAEMAIIQVQANRVQELAAKARERWEKELREVAKLIDLVTGDEWTMAYAVDQGSYGSQGYGASRYASASAESYADTFRLLGLPVKVVPVTHEYSTPSKYYGKTYMSFEVHVQTTQETIDIAKYKPVQSMREWVRSQWARGVNPRVMNPFLSHGYEEANGLDYFGNDLRKKEVVA